MAKKKQTCIDCGKVLAKDEIAVCRKLIAEDTEDLMCLECFSVFLGCTVDDLKTKISEFKEQGCTLFI